MEQEPMEVTPEVTSPRYLAFTEDFAYVAITAIMLVTYATINLSLFLV